MEEVKKEEDFKMKKNDKESAYKRFFSGRSSIHSRQITTALDFYKKAKPEGRNFGCQVDIQQKAVLHRSSLNVQTSREPKSFERIFEKKSLCVVGQKVDEDLVINGNTVGILAEMDKNFLKPRT